jgi:hypothetical protein
MVVSAPTTMLDTDEVVRRVNRLQGLNQDALPDRGRIRSLLNGGAEGLRALLGDRAKMFGSDVPAPNLILSGLTRLAQKIGRQPTIKILPPPTNHQETAQKRASKRERIVQLYDRLQRLPLQLPQVGRWLPGYGYAVWVLGETIGPNGHPYPVAELRDPYTCFPGVWGTSQQPTECAFSYRTTYKALEDAYGFAKVHPGRPETVAKNLAYASASAYQGLAGAGSWESQGPEVEVYEYHDRSGVYLILPEASALLDAAPNTHLSGPRFVIAKRFAFDRLIGQYDHVFGLLGMMAKLNVLMLIAAEDNVFTETNIVGDIDSGKYKKGRNAVNILSPGTEVTKPVNMASPEVARQIDRTERHIRLTAGYPVSDDAESSSAWITGRGTEELKEGIALEVREYQTVLAEALETLDARRLEWDERLYGGRRKPLVGYGRDGVPFAETYDPALDIKGDYDTNRVYGLMAGWDEDRKIIGGLQLMTAEVIDDLTLQENLDGLTDVAAIRERIIRKKAMDLVYAGLAQAMQQGDPRATMALIDIIDQPGDALKVLRKFYTPEGEQMSPEEEALVNPPPMPQGQLNPTAAPPDVQSVLSQLNMAGAPKGGVQTVATRRR